MADPIRVVSVRGMNTPAQRSSVVYVGRAFAGWPASPFQNPYRPRSGVDAVAAYRHHLAAMEEGDPRFFGEMLAKLWEATNHGEKPLGCWCGEWKIGDGGEEFCHAIVVAKLFGAPPAGSEVA